ncbi:MAG: hypothetical protein WCY62_03275 [Clostridia bacterium]|jgi:uridine kinase
MEEAIRAHNRAYPKATVCDWFKLIYQNEFGNGHFVDDEVKCLGRLIRECASAQENGIPVFDIGNGYVRLDLYGLTDCGIPLRVINRMFVESAKANEGNIDSFWSKISILEKAVKDIPLPIDMDEFLDYEKKYVKAGCPAVSHSDIYRDNYHPSYRVIKKAYADRMDLWKLIESRSKAKKKSDECLNIAIDGMCTSGKSELASLIHSLYDCNIIHMDDFFLRPYQRTCERLIRPGGNIDYERFKDEVIVNLDHAAGFVYYAYDCQTGKLNEKKNKPGKMNVIEGSYSMHPYFGGAYDIKIFMETARENQYSRILKRNGGEMLIKFKEEWIPMEDRYIRSAAIKDRCDLVYRT